MSNDNKTLAVDVLGVIDGLSALWRDESKIVGRWDSADELDSIRPAVAALIASGVRVAAAFRALGLDDSLINRSRLARECEEALVAFDTALARVKGESA